ncbi:hypothetical protein BDZ94DRAFT_1264737, partial [Collybia nuda]
LRTISFPIYLLTPHSILTVPIITYTFLTITQRYIYSYQWRLSLPKALFIMLLLCPYIYHTM